MTRRGCGLLGRSIPCRRTSGFYSTLRALQQSASCPVEGGGVSQLSPGVVT
jgi:hypothetical protein